MKTKSVIGPNGFKLTETDLPSATTKRWVIRRKAEVAAAVNGGMLSLEEACRRYLITIEEFRSWCDLIDEHGMHGGYRLIEIYRHPVAGSSLPSTIKYSSAAKFRNNWHF